jgi:hypothetical protein
MGRTRMTAAAKRLKLISALLPTTRLAFFLLSLSTSTRSAAGERRRGRQRGRPPPPTHPPCVVACWHARRSADGTRAERLADAPIPLTSQSQPLVDRSLLARRRHHHRHSLPLLASAGAAGPPGGGGQVLGGLEAPATAVIWAPIRRRLSHSDLSALGGRRARCDRASEPLEASRCSIGIGVGRPHR